MNGGHRPLDHQPYHDFVSSIKRKTGAYHTLVLIVAIQSLSCVRLLVTPSTAARQASLSFTISQSLLKLTSIESMMPSNHLILCHPLLLLPSIFPSIRVFTNELALRIRWPKYWSFSINPSWTGWHVTRSTRCRAVYLCPFCDAKKAASLATPTSSLGM